MPTPESAADESRSSHMLIARAPIARRRRTANPLGSFLPSRPGRTRRHGAPLSGCSQGFSELRTMPRWCSRCTRLAASVSAHAPGPVVGGQKNRAEVGRGEKKAFIPSRRRPFYSGLGRASLPHSSTHSRLESQPKPASSSARAGLSLRAAASPPPPLIPAPPSFLSFLSRSTARIQCECVTRSKESKGGGADVAANEEQDAASA